MASRQGAIRRVSDWVQTGGFKADLTRLVAIESESQTPEKAAELRRYLTDGITPLLETLGFQTKVLPNPDPKGGPFLIADRIEKQGLPTVLTYGHGDVVYGQRGRWAEGLDPYRLQQKGDRLYGRGTADNKGQHLINLTALRMVLAERGHLGFNVKLILEMGEEAGSAGLDAFVGTHKDRLAADVLIASDGPRLQPEVPTVFTGSRGALNFGLSVNLRDGAHHSGNFGGLLADPAMILAHALAGITDARGSLQIPEWRPDSLTPEISAMLRDLPVGGGGPEISADWGEPGLSPAERVFGWNSFAVLALKSGVPHGPQNAIAGHARAACQLRFVTGTDQADILPALRRHLDRRGFQAVEITTENGVNAPATRLDPGHPWVRFTAQSCAKTTGQPPHVLPNLGGFIPNHVFSDILGLPTIWLPHSYAGCNQHAPDEHVLLPVSESAAQVMAGLFWDLDDPDRKDPCPTL